MNPRFWLVFGSLLCLTGALKASENSSSSTGNPNVEETAVTDEGEDKGIIPRSVDLHVSTRTVTPVTLFPEKQLMDQGREELTKAQDLWTKGYSEAASDTALEAYDDFMAVRLPRRKRKKIFPLRHQAATLYVDAGITFINSYVEKTSRSIDGIAEGRGRLEDLRDVACNYPELNRKLNTAIEGLPVVRR